MVRLLNEMRMWWNENELEMRIGLNEDEEWEWDSNVYLAKINGNKNVLEYYWYIYLAK